MTIKNKINDTQQGLIIIAITFILAVLIWRIGGDEKNILPKQKMNIHTMIPRGYNLYALEIANIESIDALVDDYALVNIFNINEKRKAQLILQKVKLIRSPKNPSYFAVLATNEDLEVITRYAGPFKVAIQNPNKPNAEFKNKIIKPKRSIIAEDKL